MRNFVITLILGAAIGIGCSKAFDQSAVAMESQEPMSDINTDTVLGIMHFVLPDDVSDEEVGRYLTDVHMPAWKAAWKKTGSGVEVHLIKGERGGTEGQYGVLFVYPDLETRNRYFPGTEGTTEAVEELLSYSDVPGSLAEVFEGVENAHLGDQIFIPTK